MSFVPRRTTGRRSREQPKVCGRFGGVGVIPTRCVGGFEDQLGVEGAAQGKLAEDFWKLCHLC